MSDDMMAGPHASGVWHWYKRPGANCGGRASEQNERRAEKLQSANARSKRARKPDAKDESRPGQGASRLGWQVERSFESTQRYAEAVASKGVVSTNESAEPTS